MKKILAFVFVFGLGFCANAWEKTAPWTQEQDQTWTETSRSGDYIYISNGDWTLMLRKISGTDYAVHKVEVTGSNGLINFDTICRDFENADFKVVRLGWATNDQPFKSNGALTSIILSADLPIYGETFYLSSNLQKVVFPYELSSLGHWGTFNGCNSITEMVNALPEGATVVPQGMFTLSNNGNSLPAVRIPKSITEIGPGAFNGAYLGGSSDTQTFESLSQCTYLSSIGNRAFYNAKCGGDLYLTNCAVTIEHDAFINTALKSVAITVPGSFVDYYTFQSLGLTNINLSGVIHIGDQAFQQISTSLSEKTILLSPAITNIGSKAFYRVNRSYIDVREPYPGEEIPDVECRIGSEAFEDFSEYCQHKHSLVIPFKGHSTIESKAFHWTVNVDKFIFWGKAPTFAVDAFNAVGSTYSYKSQIVAPKGMDDANWEALAIPLTQEEQSRDDIPANCFGTYTNNSGCVYWMCWGTTPYLPAPAYGIIDDGAVTNRYLNVSAAVYDAKVLGKAMTVVLNENSEEDVSIPEGMDVTFDFGEHALKGNVVVSGFASLTVKSGYIDGQISVEPYDPGKLYFTGDQNGWKFTEMEHLGRGMFLLSGVNPGTNWKFTPTKDFAHKEWLSHGNANWDNDGDEYSQVMELVNNISGGDFIRPTSAKFDIYADTLNCRCYLVAWEGDDDPPARKVVPPLADPSIISGYFTGTVSDDWVAAGSVKSAVSVVKDAVTYTTKVGPSKSGLMIFIK